MCVRERERAGALIVPRGCEGRRNWVLVLVLLPLRLRLLLLLLIREGRSN